ncbi:PTS fructose transporter subunit IIBC [Virgibacillus pantothenticus]|uniref:PTS fructose transporter subunit IIB n=1 Tax=Virgibacillus pantothenticus TaxID=1473 RepID=A0A0L0QVZ5_VIRPA|nr:fructose-specific PTS transporter subunit EIIC [Virgibacillus pantothenticus]KNE22378.1 PTS fructose transporter subunit IIB [Virgibacillus pantothenticus]MBU8565398.1 fructose-specific PTS transporter subunit EIIC [Virgibacillus pantothenticus]MBU8599383.1 fructose-specific PTS transporter subunit EIIC [Virgibacillus pantothenticus]MBU8633717.1 fructose-specific PTS transporter subunit EIIC [Virgibacillus pantothenticus]MBU8641662.1 fructose-specific PTS transporter subunit EIIC [Virgibaci
MSKKKIVGVTACSAGIAHTYMAAESLEKAGGAKGYEIKVETQGSIGVENKLTPQEIEEADVVILAVEINIDMSRFVGKRVLRVRAAEAIKNPEALIEKALNQATSYGEKGTKAGIAKMGKTEEGGFFQHIMAGISYMIPMVIASGLILAIANVYAFQKDEAGRIVNWGFDTSTFMGDLMSNLFSVGQVGFLLMIPLFAGFVANSIAGKPAIAAAMIGTYIANDAEMLGAEAGGGFLAAILVAFAAGYLVKILKKIPYPKMIQPIVPIMILPLVSTLIISIFVLYVIGTPMASMMDFLYEGLTTLNENYAAAPVIVGVIIGAMVGFDLGGPINKTALVFGTAVFTDTVAKYGIEGANFVPQTATQAAISVAPLGIWLASILFKKKFSPTEKVSAHSAFGMGMVGVTEGAIPFAAQDPIRMIPAFVAGSAVAGGLAAGLGAKFYGGIGSPLGTFIGYIEQPIPFVTWIFSVMTGVLVTAIIIGFTKKKVE